MNDNIKKLFLLTTVIFLFIGLSAISATDSADDMTLSTDTNTQESTISTDTAANNNIDNNINIQYTKSDKNIEKDNTTTVKKDGTSSNANTINLNNENIKDYFEVLDTDASTLDTIPDNTILQFDEIINDVNFWYFNTTASNITVTANNNIVFTDQQFLIESPNVTFKNLLLEYTPEFEYSRGIDVEESGFIMQNCQVNYDASIIEGDINTILLLKGDNSIITNSTFDCRIISTGIDWDFTSMNEYNQMPTTVPIVIMADNVNITDNVITINEKGSDGTDYPSFYGIYIGGYYINFTRNNISLTGSNGYVYTVYVKSSESKKLTSHVTISDNNITGISQHNYTAGVYLDGSNYQNITVINNNIHAVSSKDFKEGNMVLQDVVYAVVITDFSYTGGNYIEGTGDVHDNSIINNTIIAEGHQVYGFEQFGGDNTLLSGNTMIIEGTCAQAMGIIGYNTLIENNNLIVIGQTAGGESSPDYVPPTTSGVQVLHGSQTTINNNNMEVTGARGILILDTDNTITNNNITVTDYQYTIETRSNAIGNIIENNLLITDTNNGSETINDVAGENTIGNNHDYELIQTGIYPEDAECTLGDELELFVTIENEEEEEYDYDGQSLILYANGEEIASEEIEDGFAFFTCDVPLSWYKNITLIVKYPGSDECTPAEATVDLTVKIPTSIQADDNIIAQPNSQLTSILVKDIMNNTVDAANIDVYQNDIFISDLSEYTITGTGSYPIKLVFDGGLLNDGYTYLSSEKEVTITVNESKPSVNISLDLEDEYNLGDTIEIITGVEDENEQVISGLNVDLYCNNEFVTSLTSDDDGWIMYDYTPTTVGDYIFTLRVNDENYASNEATQTVTVNKKIIPVSILIELDDEYELGDTVDIMANIVDENYDNIADVTIDLYIDDEFVTSLLSDEEGIISYRYTPESAGTYTITLKVNDEDYTGEDESTDLNVVITPKETFISFVDLPSNLFVGDIVTVYGQVVDEDDEVVIDASVQVSFNDYVESFVTDGEGRFAFDINASSEGSFVVTASYGGNDVLLPSEAEETITVYKKSVYISFIDLPSELYVGDIVTVYGQVVNEDDEAVIDASVQVSFNDYVDSVITDGEGRFAFDINASSEGSFVVTASYGGNDVLLPSEAEETITVYKKSVYISFIDLPSELYVGDIVTVYGQVVNEDDEAVIDASVQVSFNDYVDSVITDGEGKFAFGINASSEGSFVVTASYGGNDVLLPSEAEETITVYKKSVYISFIDLPSELYVGDIVTVYGQVVNEDDEAVIDASVQVSFNDYVESFITDGEGKFAFDINASSEGSFVVTASYGGNDALLPSEAEETITVNKKIIPVFVSVDELGAEYELGSDVEVVAVVKDVDDNFVAGVNVDLYVGDELVGSAVSNDSGLLYYVYTPSAVGDYTLIFRVNDDDFTGDDYQVDFSVYKRIIPVFVSVDELGAEYELGSDVEVVAVVKDVDDNFVAGVNVDLYVGDELVSSAVSNDSGLLYYVYTPSAVGDYTLIFRVNDDDFTGDDYSVDFSVYKRIIPVSVLIELDDEYQLGDVVDIMANVVDDNYDDIAGVNVDLYIDDEFIASVESDEDGIISYEYTPTAAGSYNITFKVNDEDYTGLDANALLIVNKIPTITTVEVLNNKYGDVTISVTVSDENDEDITQGYIVVTDSEGNIIVTADVTTSDLTLNIPTETTGQLEVTVTYQENNIYQESNDVVVIEVSKLSSYLSISAVPEEVYVGENVTLSGDVYDENGNDIEGTVQVEINGQTYEVSVIDGSYSINIEANDAGSYIATATFNGNDILLPIMNQTAFTVNKIPTTTTVEVINNTLGNVIISVTVTDNNGQVITTGNVNVKTTDYNITVPIESENTTIQLDITTKTNVTGIIEYVENDKYLTSEDVINLTVIIPTTIETADTIDALVNEEVTLNASVVDIIGTTIDAAVINVYENDTFISDLSNYKFTPITSGSYAVRLVFDGGLLSDGSTYIASEKEVTINVNKRQAMMTIEAEDTIENTPTTVTVQLTDLTDENMIINEGTVEFTDEEGNILAVENVETSTATTQITFNTIGEHTITATFQSPNVYETVNATTTITVNKKIIPVIIYLELDDEYELGTNVEVTATIEDEDENTVAGVNVDLYIDDEFVTSLISDDDGWIVYDYTPAAPGDYTITLKVNDDDYTASDVTETFTVTQPAKEYSLQIVTKNFTIGETMNIQANIYYGNEFEQEIAENITKGKVSFKVNGKSLKDENGKVIYAKIVNGTAILYNYTIPESWYQENITIEATYSGSTQCDSLKTGKVLMNVSKAKPKITIQDINTTVGSTITLQATVTDDDKTINTGKVIFKINGKTLKDENGKVIYVQITNNIASMEYTLPSSFKANNYTLTAIFTSSEYERMEDSKTLIITND